MGTVIFTQREIPLPPPPKGQSGKSSFACGFTASVIQEIEHFSTEDNKVIPEHSSKKDRVKFVELNTKTHNQSGKEKTYVKSYKHKK